MESLAALREELAGIADSHLRRITLFGSRATGHAHVGSDVDLAAFIEPPRDSAWGTHERAAEHQRLYTRLRPAVQGAFGASAKLDLNVRTLDQAAEARDVLGTVEYLAATTGIVLYERPPERPPSLRRERREVIRDQTVAWIEYAEHALATVARASTIGFPSSNPASGGAQARIALAVRRACVAVCVWQQVPLLHKSVPLSAAIARMASVAPALAATIATLIDGHRPSVEVARRVLREVIAYLGTRDPALAPALASVSKRVQPQRLRSEIP